MFRFSLTIIEIPINSLDVWQNHETKHGFEWQSNEIPEITKEIPKRWYKHCNKQKKRKSDRLVSGD